MGCSGSKSCSVSNEPNKKGPSTSTLHKNSEDWNVPETNTVYH